MSLEVIKELQSSVKDLEVALEASKSDAEEIRTELKEAVKAKKTVLEEEKKYSDKEVSAAKEKLDSLYIQSKILGRDMSTFKEYKDAANVVEKALTPSSITAYAAEEFSNSLLEGLELELTVANLFKTIQMPANRQTLSIPSRTGDLSAYLIAPAASAVESAITGGKVSFTVQKMMAYSAIADEADEELVAAVTDITKAELVRSLARGLEDSIVNGDTSFATANSPKKLYNGLRKVANANTVDSTGTITLANINATRKLMGSYGIMPKDLAIIVNPSAYYQLFNIAEFLTIDKIGSKAAILSGQVGSVFGFPVFVSEYIANDLEADGTDHATSGATSEALLVNAQYFMKCQRGTVSLEKQRQAVTQTDDLVSSMSVDFKNVAVGGVPAAALVNVTP